MLYSNKAQLSEVFTLGLARIPHALLLCGAPGLGKLHFAEQFAQIMLCENADTSGLTPRSCGLCSSCQMIAAGTHLDLRTIKPENEEEESDSPGNVSEGKVPDSTASATTKAKAKKRSATSIKIGAIRALEDFVFVGSHRQGRRLVIITDAEAMNMVAANALLKILEEPPASVYFILITSKPDRLLRTLVSRCRQLSFVRPSATEAQTMLAALDVPVTSDSILLLAGGAPLQVARWHESRLIDVLEPLVQTFQRPGNCPIALAERWDALLKKDAGLKVDLLVEAVQRWVVNNAINAREQLVPGVFAGWRALLQSRRSASHPLNQLLFLEELASHALRATGATMTPFEGMR